MAMNGELASRRQVNRHLRRRRRRRDGQRQQCAEAPGDGHDSSTSKNKRAWCSSRGLLGDRPRRRWACWAWTWRRWLVKLGGWEAMASGASFGRGENKPLPRECSWRPWLGSARGPPAPLFPFFLALSHRLVPSGSPADTMTRGMQGPRGVTRTTLPTAAVHLCKLIRVDVCHSIESRPLAAARSCAPLDSCDTSNRDGMHGCDEPKAASSLRVPDGSRHIQLSISDAIPLTFDAIMEWTPLSRSQLVATSELELIPMSWIGLL